MNSMAVMGTAAFGAVCQEVIHWYQLRSRLSANVFRLLPRSWEYWAITGLMVVCSAIGVWLLYGEKGVPRDVLFILGAAFPALFKKIADATAGGDIKLGGSGASVWRAYMNRQPMEDPHAE